MSEPMQCLIRPYPVHADANRFRQVWGGRGGQEPAEAAVGAVAAAIPFQITIVENGIHTDVVQVIDVDISARIAHIGQLVVGRGH